MQYQIPQYMEAPESIIGPFTLKQFGYVVVAGIIIFITYYVLHWVVWLFVGAISTGAALAFAFIKIHGRPLDQVAISAIKFTLQPKLYLWGRKPEEKEFIVPEEKSDITAIKTQVGSRNLVKDLAEKLMTAKMPIPNKESGRLFFDQNQETYIEIKRISGDKEFAKKVDFK